MAQVWLTASKWTRNHGERSTATFVSSAIGAVVTIIGAWAFSASSGSGQQSFVVASILATIVAILVLTRGLDYLASVCAIGAFATLGLTGIRVSAAISLSDVLFLGSGMIIVLAYGLGKMTITIPKEYVPLMKGCGLIVLGGFIASILSPDRISSLLELPKLLIAVWLIPILILLWRPTKELLTVATIAFVCSAVASSLVAILEPAGEWSIRSNGLATHPNSLAMIAVLALGPVWATLAYLRSSVLSLLALGTAVILVWSIVVSSGSRAGVIGLIVVTLVFLSLVQSKVLWLGVGLGILTIWLLARLEVLDLFSAVSIGRLFGGENTQFAAAAQRSNAGRLDTLKLAVEDFQSRPFVGIGLYRAGATTSVFLTVLVAMGILALMGLLKVIWFMVKAAMAVRADHIVPGSWPRMLMLGWISGYAGLMAANSFQNAIWERFLWVPPAIVASLLVIIQDERSKVSKSPTTWPAGTS